MGSMGQGGRWALRCAAAAAWTAATMIHAAGEPPVPAVPAYPMEGAWAAESIRLDGAAPGADVVKHWRFTFREDRLVVRNHSLPELDRTCGYVLDFESSPPTLDVVFPPDGRRVPAIVKREGDRLTVAMREPADERGRPKEFVSEKDSGVRLVVFRKIVDHEKEKP